MSIRWILLLFYVTSLINENKRMGICTHTLILCLNLLILVVSIKLSDNSHVRQVRSCLFGRLFLVLHRNIAVYAFFSVGEGRRRIVAVLRAIPRITLSEPSSQTVTYNSVRSCLLGAVLPCSSSEYRGFTRFFLWVRGREIVRFCYASFIARCGMPEKSNLFCRA